MRKGNISWNKSVKLRKKAFLGRVVPIGLLISIFGGCCCPKPYQPFYITEEKISENIEHVVLEGSDLVD